MKRIVLDANILLRAVLGKKVRFLLEKHSGSTQFFTPKLCYGEAQKYLPPLFKKRNLPIAPALEVLERITCLIQVVDDDLYQSYATEAKKRIAVRDINDWPVVALALMLSGLGLKSSCISSYTRRLI